MAIHNIWIMAAIAVVLSAVVYGAVLRHLAPRAERRLLLAACLLIMPMSAGAMSAALPAGPGTWYERRPMRHR
jgi:hypothetical protein